MSNSENPVLFIVGTPIGNLADMAPRAIETLKQVDLVLTEDTRSFRKLASAFRIETNAESFFEHNERKKLDRIVSDLEAGRRIALISDAGMPLVSDPGFLLVRACRERNIPYAVIPGPSAVLTALVASGFEMQRFSFEGFLPQKSGKRKAALEDALSRIGATVFFESPHRIEKAVSALVELDPSANVYIGRELTKRFEEHLHGTAEEVLASLQGRETVKGELVLVVRGVHKKDKGN